MKSIRLALILLTTVFISCSKNEKCDLSDANVTASATEVANLEAYLNTAGITGAQKHPSGFYYKITQVGTGKAVVNLCSQVTVKYTGKLTNGTVFDPSTPGSTSSIATFTLGNLIVGWQKGIPLISTGGKITLYIPPSLGYGSSPNGAIPANSILIFDIELGAVN